MNANPRRLPQWLLFSIAIVLGLCAAAPLWGSGMVNTRGGGDSPFLLQRTLDMADNLRHGIVPPRWMSHGAYDLGYPFFNHYAALPYYLSGGLSALRIDAVLAIQITQTLGFVLSAVAVMMWARQIFNNDTANIAVTAAYTFAPFHMVNVYVRGDSLSEFYAFIWYPLILWSLHRAVQRPRARQIVIAGLCYSALVLTHNVSAVIFSPFALAYALWMTFNTPERRNTWGSYLLIVLPFVLGIAFSMWFWLPALGETGFVHMGEEFTAGYFHYSNHFRTLNMVQPGLTFDYSVAGVVEAAGPFSMSLVQALLALAGLARIVYTLVRRSGSASQRRDLWFIAGGCLLATVMITPLSEPLWRYLPLLDLTQFPWRFLSIQSLLTAMLTGVLFMPLGQREMSDDSQFHRHWMRISGLAIVAGLTLMSALWQLHPDRLLLGENAASWDTLALYESFTGNIGTTIRYEYLPVAVNPRPYVSDAVIDGEGKVIAEGQSPVRAALLERTPAKQRWSVTLDTADTVTFPLHWWPGWHARVDGNDISTAAYPGSGRLSLALPAGQHEIVLFLQNSMIETLGIVISIASIILSTLWIVLDKQPWHSLDLQIVLVVSLGLVLAAAFPTLNHGASTASAPFFDFNAMPFPHAGPVIFPSVTLHDVQLNRDSGAPGDTLDVDLAWSIREGSSVTTTVSLVSPAEARHNVPYTLVAVDAAVTPVMRVSLALPDDLSRGVYLLKVQVFDDLGERFGRTESGLNMGTLYAGVVRVPQGTSAAGLPVFAELTDLTLHSVTAEQNRDTELALKLVWSTPGTPQNWTLSLRLLDAAGEQVIRADGSALQMDVEPGYGYLPTTLWTPGEQITDYLSFALPEGLAPGEYLLHIIVYQRGTRAAGGESTIPVTLTTPTLYDLRDSCCEQTRKGKTILCQDSGLALLHAEVPDNVQEGEDLVIFAQWNAVEPPRADVMATWTLRDEQGAIIGLTSGPLATGSNTGTWPRNTWVQAPVYVDLPSLLPGGTYTLHIAINSDQTHTACDLPYTVDVIPRPREFVVPPLTHEQNADFGDTLRLLGYDMQQDRKTGTLALTLWWQALKTPLMDYKRFVHIYNPQTEQIAAQDDAMPRDWTYPTSWWQTGEVVSETLSLDIREIPSGTYAIGVGWYDPASGIRLAVSGADAVADRVTLGESLRVR